MDLLTRQKRPVARTREVLLLCGVQMSSIFVRANLKHNDLIETRDSFGD
jgi:hypothetical protein